MLSAKVRQFRWQISADQGSFCIISYELKMPCLLPFSLRFCFIFLHLLFLAFIILQRQTVIYRYFSFRLHFSVSLWMLLFFQSFMSFKGVISRRQIGDCAILTLNGQCSGILRNPSSCVKPDNIFYSYNFLFIRLGIV